MSSRTARTWSGSLTSISSTSAGVASRLALRSVRLMALPNDVSTTSAPSSWAALATAKAMLCGVKTPVISRRLSFSSIWPPSPRRHPSGVRRHVAANAAP
jgi:hypothetical protein